MRETEKKKKNESNIQCRTVAVSQYEAKPTTTNNINYKKQHTKISKHKYT